MSIIDEPMSYWATTAHPKQMVIAEREEWHRDAWDREQIALSFLTSEAGYDTPGRTRNFGFWQRGTALG